MLKLFKIHRFSTIHRRANDYHRPYKVYDDYTVVTEIKILASVDFKPF